jgi:hypothetical protein
MMEILKYHRGCKLLDIVLDVLLLLSDVYQVRITGGTLREQREGLLVDSGKRVNLAQSFLRLPFVQLLLGVCVPQSPPLELQALPAGAHKDGVLEEHCIGIVRLDGLHYRGQRQPGQEETHLLYMLPDLIL